MAKPIAEKLDIDVIAEMMKTVTALQEQVEALTKRLDAPVITPIPPAPEPVQTNSALPVPSDYRQIVDTVLNPRFGIEINPAPDMVGFDFSILVPRDYSNAPKPHWDTYKEDRRSRIILSALGSNGVRDWATKVYENFDNETKARITMARATI